MERLDDGTMVDGQTYRELKAVPVDGLPDTMSPEQVHRQIVDFSSDLNFVRWRRSHAPGYIAEPDTTEVPVLTPREQKKVSAKIIESGRRYPNAKEYAFCGMESSQPVITVSKSIINRYRRLREVVLKQYTSAPLDKDVVVSLGWSEVSTRCIVKALEYLKEHKSDRAWPFGRLSAFDEAFTNDLRKGGGGPHGLLNELEKFSSYYRLRTLSLLCLRVQGLHQDTSEFIVYEQNLLKRKL